MQRLPIENPTIAEILNDLGRLQKSRIIQLDVSRRSVVTDHDAFKAKVLEILPSREVCQQSLDLYFDHWETIFRIVHIDDFKSLVHTHLEADRLMDLDLTILVQTVLMIAIGSQKFDMRSQIHTPFAQDACTLVKGYLDNRSSKTRHSLVTLQTWTLLVLTYQVFLIPAEQLWLETGHLVRHAMVIGLHRDPSAARTISPYAGELRRRLWATILEFDLQASLSYGMPMAITRCATSCQIPSNIPDAMLKYDCLELPEGKPDNEWTDSCLLRNLAQSRGSRMKIVQRLADKGANMDTGDMYSLWLKLLRLLQNHRLFFDRRKKLEQPRGQLGSRLYQTHLLHAFMEITQRRHLQNASLGSDTSLTIAAKETVFLYADIYRDSRLSSKKDGDYEDKNRTCGGIYMVMARGAALLAGFILCSMTNSTQVATTFVSNELSQATFEENGENVRILLSALASGLPCIGLKGVARLAVALQSVEYDQEMKEEDLFTKMRAELLPFAKPCRRMLEGMPETSSEGASRG